MITGNGTKTADHWVECRVADRNQARAVFRNADEAGALSVHCFWFEPWHPTGGVVRVRLPVDARIRWPHVEPWNPEGDEELFGEAWPWVQRLFEASTALGAMRPNREMLNKVTHCHLNAHGLDVHEEFVWALRFAWNRARIGWMDRRRLAGRLFRA